MSFRRYLGLLRGLLVLVGLGPVAAGLDTVASMPTAPPVSDGFLEGLSYLFALLAGIAGLVTVQIGYSLPAGTGRFRFGPLAHRRAGTRAAVTVLVYLLMTLLMVYVVPLIVPGVTASETYAAGLFVFALGGAVGILVALVITIAGLLIETYRQYTESHDSPTVP